MKTQRVFDNFIAMSFKNYKSFFFLFYFLKFFFLFCVILFVFLLHKTPLLPTVLLDRDRTGRQSFFRTSWYHKTVLDHNSCLCRTQPPKLYVIVFFHINLFDLNPFIEYIAEVQPIFLHLYLTSSFLDSAVFPFHML